MILRKALLVFYQLKIPDPKFSSQTKDKLVSSEVRNDCRNIINEKLSFGLIKIHQLQKLF